MIWKIPKNALAEAISWNTIKNVKKTMFEKWLEYQLTARRYLQASFKTSNPIFFFKLFVQEHDMKNSNKTLHQL